MASCSILILEPSPHTSGEPDELAAELADRGIRSERAATLTEAIERLERAPVPALIVLLEPRPGIWTEREVASLRATAPLARLLRVTGSWCEGQGRSGKPVAGSLAVGRHLAVNRIAREFAEISSGGSLAAPLTATVEDLILANCRPETRSPRSELIAIHAPRTAQANAWATMCRGLGYRVQLHPACAAPRPAYPAGEYSVSAEDQTADILMWDCEPRDLADVQCVRAIVDLAMPAPVIAVCGFPRPRDVEFALRGGVAAVLSKPLVVADFQWQVSRLFGACRDG